jgi:hypothetical protein
MSSLFARTSFIAATILTSTMVSSAALFTAPTTVTNIWTYTDFGDGDVSFQITGSSGSCYGFWIKATDKGAKTAYATLLAAKAEQAEVAIYADDADLWSGSGSPYCRVRAIVRQ